MTLLSVDIPDLETERLRFRAPSLDDLDAEAEFYASERSVHVGGPKERREVWRQLAGIIGHWVFRGYGFWALEEKDTGAYVGRTGLWFPYGWKEREIGWTLMPAAWGKGYATEAGLAARAHAYDVLGWNTAISQIDQSNEASKAVARRLGASFESTYDDPKFGTIEIWRHLSPADLENGGMGAYA